MNKIYKNGKLMTADDAWLLNETKVAYESD